MLDKFLFGNKHIPEMYFGNIPVAKIYFGNTLIWEKEGYVPYDTTCSIIITGDDTTQKFTVQVLKNGNDVTSSLEKFNGWAYIVNDVLPVYRLFVHDIPYSSYITNATEFSITELINAYKAAEGISDTRYDNTKGEYSIDASAITSKAGGSFPSRDAISCQNHIFVPYSLTEDYSTNDVWIVVQQNTSPTPLEIKTIQVATTFINSGNTEIYVIHESGICVYKKILYSNTPSITTKEIDGITYNYVTIDLTGLDTGTFSLKRNEKYFIKIKHSNNNQNHYYYRNGGILGIVGYTTTNINVPNDSYDVSSLVYEGVITDETSMLETFSNIVDDTTTPPTIITTKVNHYAKYTGTSGKFESNKIYKCKTAFLYRGNITDNDKWMLAANDGEVGYYSGPSSELGITGAFVKSGAAIWVSEQSNYTNIISSDPQEGTIFKYTGNTTGGIFVKNRFYSCNTQISKVTEITAEPDANSVSVDDYLFAINDIYSGSHSSGWNGAGFYKVTSVIKYTVTKTFSSNPVTYNDISDVSINDIIHYTGNYWNGDWQGPGYYKLVSKDTSTQTYSVTKLTDASFTVVKQNNPVTDETDNMKAKLTTFNRSTYFDEIYGTSTDLNGITINTDHKHEILMGS